jgi:drug/metabolite transporter (DMT)-like permease
MGILLGLSAAIAWGLSDFCARFAAHKIGSFRTLLYMQFIGLTGLSLWLLVAGGWNKWDWPTAWWTGLLAIFNAGAGLALYRAFQTGLLSVVSPIAASYGAISLLLALWAGQKPSVLALVGLVITIVGVVLASADLTFFWRDPRRSKKKLAGGIWWAILAALFLGVVLWGLGYVTPTLGNFLPAWIFRLVGPPVVLALALPMRQSMRWPTRAAWPWLLGLGGLDTMAYVLYNLGLNSAESGVIAVISSLFSAVTILLARLFLHEKLVFNQWAGVFIILAGVGLVSAS